MKRPSPDEGLPFGAEELRWVTNTATLVFGEREAVLVDTFLTLDENRELIDWVASFDVALRYVYLTHGHLDHCYGIHKVLEAFPDARAIGSPRSVEKTRADCAPERVQNRRNLIFDGQLDQYPVAPEPFEGDHLDLEGHRIEFIQTGYTDTDGTTAVWVPGNSGESPWRRFAVDHGEMVRDTPMSRYSSR